VLFTVAPIPNAVSYVWAYSGTGATINNGANDSITINFGANASSGNLTVMGTNSCGNGIVSVNFPVSVNPLPAASGAITGPATVCQGQNSVSYNVPPIANATAYVWSFSGLGATISNASTNSVTINFASNATSGNLNVLGTNDCGNGVGSANFPVTVNLLPSAAGIITGTFTVCQGQNAVPYSTAAITNATTYTWSYSGVGATFVNGNSNNITVNFAANATAGNLSVAGTNSCGNGVTSVDFPVAINLLPSNAGLVSGSSSVCQGQNSVSYSIPLIGNATTYAWNYSGTGASISNGATNSVTIQFASNATSGNLTVSGLNFCGSGVSSPNFPIAVNVLPIADAGSNQNIGYGANTVLTGSATGGSGSYNWQWEPSALLANPTAQNPVTVNLTNTVQFTLTASDAVTTCSGTDFVLISITGGPLSVSATANPATTCAGESVQLQALVGGGTGNYTFSWTSEPSGFTSNLQDPVVYPSVTTQYTVNVNDGNATMGDFANVAVNPLPPVPAVPLGPDTVDLRIVANSLYTVAALQFADSYTWELNPTNAGNISGNGITGTVVWNPNYLGVAKIKVASTNSCGQSVFSSEKQTFVDNTTGLDEMGKDVITIYPNPNDGSFMLNTPLEVRRIKVYDTFGRLMFDTKVENTNKQFEFKLTNGLYLVHIQTLDKELVRKMVVKTP
jgi:hypothetical protein